MMDQQVKERMVGAAVLMVAAVIFIPMILAGSPEQRNGERNAPVAVETSASEPVPASNGSGFSSRIVPLDGTSSKRSAANERALKEARERVSEERRAEARAPLSEKVVKSPPATVAPAAKPAPKAVAKRPAERKPDVAPVTQNVADGWVVQLGSFSNTRNAHALRDRLNGKGYKAFARSSGEGAEAVTRVYVGPGASREQAQQRVTRLFSETRLKGIVIRKPK